MISTRPGGNFARSLSAAGMEPVVQQRVDLLGDGLADPRELLHPARAGQLGHRPARLADRLGGVAVGHHAVDHGPVELVQARQLVEGLCDLSVPVPPRLGYAAVPRAWLILPTYNEAENIEAIVAAALPQLASTGLEHRILIVDDGSPDGTGAIADRLAAEHETVEVLHRPGKGGLGPAYLAGFERALAGGADLVLEMDSDFSHDPADLPRLIAAARDADLVLGSRYVPGGRRDRLGPPAPAGEPRRVRLRPDPARRAGPGPHRRLQVLSPARARGARPRQACTPTATPSRSS